MRYIKHMVVTALVIIIVLTLVLSCAPAAPKESIKIGVIVPYSGLGAWVGPRIEHGIEVKLDEVGWEIMGRKIEIIGEDSAGDPVTGVDKAKKLVEADKVDVVFGTMYAHVQFPVTAYLAESGTPNIAMTNVATDLYRAGFGNFFMTLGTMLGSSYYLGHYAFDELGYRTATVLHDDYVGGQEYMQGFIEGFKEKGGTIIQTQRPPLGTFDYAPYISAMDEADVVAIWFIPPEIPAFYKQYYEFGKKMPILYTYLAGEEQDWVATGDTCIGTVGQTNYSSLIDNDINKRFVEALQEKYGASAEIYELASYIGTTVFLEAVKATKGNTAHDKINEALKEVSVDTPGGRISFTPEGLAIGGQHIVQVVKKADRYVVEILKTYEQVVRKAPSE